MASLIFRLQSDELLRHDGYAAIVRAVANADNLQPADLCETLDISPEAMSRHLRKLKTLGVVQMTKKKGCVLSFSRSDVAEALLRIILR